MKRIILSILFSIFILLNSFNKFEIQVSSKDQEYSRVLNETTILYKDEEFNNPLFIVPYTYYLKIIAIEANYVKVSYGDLNSDYPVISGFIRISDFYPVDNIPNNPYFLSEVTLKEDNILYIYNTLTESKIQLFDKYNLIYYGNYILNKTSNSQIQLAYVYSSFNNKMGFVEINNLTGTHFKINSDPLPIEETSSNDNIQKKDNEVSNSLGNNLQIIIVVGISIMCIALIYFLFKPSNKNIRTDKESFRDISDDE